jgi:hypothetical protein
MATHLQVSKGTLATWRREGLPYTALTARTFRYDLAKVEAWLDNRHDEPTDPDDDYDDDDEEVENPDPLFAMLDMMIPRARRLGSDDSHQLRHAPYWDDDRAREYGKEHGLVIEYVLDRRDYGQGEFMTHRVRAALPLPEYASLRLSAELGRHVPACKFTPLLDVKCEDPYSVIEAYLQNEPWLSFLKRADDPGEYLVATFPAIQEAWIEEGRFLYTAPDMVVEATYWTPPPPPKWNPQRLPVTYRGRSPFLF